MNINLEITHLLYMTFWCLIITMIIGISRLDNYAQFGMMLILTSIVLFFSWTIPQYLAEVANLNMNEIYPMGNPKFYVLAGPEGWLILLIHPLGWMAPLLGAIVAKRWDKSTGEELDYDHG